MAKSAVYVIGDRRPTTSVGEFLVIEDLIKTFKRADGSESLVLNDINLTIRDDEYVSVIGHSGCGKSTLLKIIAGLEKATVG
jgi:nitrate/nitrite transport system ATP-binding protein